MLIFKIWDIGNPDLKPLYFEAPCFGYALALAHKIDKRYCVGKVVDESEVE